MIIRIVKMTFRPEETEKFLDHFRKHKMQIRHFPGCSHLELLRDVRDSAVFFTYSYWGSEADLEQYRHSDLFRSVWKETKPLFAAKPDAWSMERIETTA